MNGVHICCQVAVNHIALLNTIFKVVAVAVNVEAHIALQQHTVCAVDGDAAPVGAAGREGSHSMTQRSTARHKTHLDEKKKLSLH